MGNPTDRNGHASDRDYDPGEDLSESGIIVRSTLERLPLEVDIAPTARPLGGPLDLPTPRHVHPHGHPHAPRPLVDLISEERMRDAGAAVLLPPRQRRRGAVTRTPTDTSLLTAPPELPTSSILPEGASLMSTPPSDPPPATPVEVEVDETPTPVRARQPRRNRFGYYAAGSAMAFAAVFCLGIVQLFSSLNATATQSPDQDLSITPPVNLPQTVQVEPADEPLPCQPYARTFIHKMEDGTRPWAVECQDGSIMTCPDATSVTGGIDLGVCIPLPPTIDEPSEDTPPE